MANERHPATFIVGVLLGGVAAAAATLWKAPQSGVQTRAKIAEGAESLIFRVLGGEPGTAEPLPLDQPRPTATPLLTAEQAGDTILLPDPLDAAPVERADLSTEPIAGAVEPTAPADMVIDGPRPTGAGH